MATPTICISLDAFVLGAPCAEEKSEELSDWLLDSGPTCRFPQSGEARLSDIQRNPHVSVACFPCALNLPQGLALRGSDLPSNGLTATMLGDSTICLLE